MKNRRDAAIFIKERRRYVYVGLCKCLLDSFSWDSAKGEWGFDRNRASVQIVIDRASELYAMRLLCQPSANQQKLTRGVDFGDALQFFSFGSDDEFESLKGVPKANTALVNR